MSKGASRSCKIHVRNVKLDPSVDLRKVAARTAGFAGADLANLVNEAALLAARRDGTAVEMRDFNEAIDRLVAGLEKKRVMSTREREIVAYHESGHAIVASVLPNMDPVHKISIVARGFGALGYTMQLPLEDRYLMQQGDLLNQLAILLGGRAAEEIAVGEISTGAQNDLQRVTDVARAMVTEWGMSEKLGTVNYDNSRRGRFLDVGMPADRGLYSEETARVIDEEVKSIIAGAHRSGAPRPARESRHARTRDPPPARERSDGRRRAARHVRRSPRRQSVSDDEVSNLRRYLQRFAATLSQRRRGARAAPVPRRQTDWHNPRQQISP